MNDLVIGLIAGFAAAIVLMGLIMLFSSRRQKQHHAEEIERYDTSIVDLRQERAEDKETNRRLRHQLVSQSPERLVEATNAAELERDSAVSERDQALEQLQLVQQDLSQANNRIADREAKLRQYREALKEIRVALEAQDRGGRTMQAANGLIDTDTAEILNTQVDEAADVSGVSDVAERVEAAADRADAAAEAIKPADISAVD